jgi:hypothetical protein
MDVQLEELASRSEGGIEFGDEELKWVRCGKILIDEDDRAAGKCYDCLVIDNTPEEDE